MDDWGYTEEQLAEPCTVCGIVRSECIAAMESSGPPE